MISTWPRTAMPIGSGRKSIPTRHDSGHPNLALPESFFRSHLDGPNAGPLITDYRILQLQVPSPPAGEPLRKPFGLSGSEPVVSTACKLTSRRHRKMTPLWLEACGLRGSSLSFFPIPLSTATGSLLRSSLSLQRSPCHGGQGGFSCFCLLFFSGFLKPES